MHHAAYCLLTFVHTVSLPEMPYLPLPLTFFYLAQLLFNTQLHILQEVLPNSPDFSALFSLLKSKEFISILLVLHAIIIICIFIILHMNNSKPAFYFTHNKKRKQTLLNSYLYYERETDNRHLVLTQKKLTFEDRDQNTIIFYK